VEVAGLAFGSACPAFAFGVFGVECGAVLGDMSSGLQAISCDASELSAQHRHLLPRCIGARHPTIYGEYIITYRLYLHLTEVTTNRQPVTNRGDMANSPVRSPKPAANCTGCGLSLLLPEAPCAVIHP
jgi:hypothetical protein